MDLRSCSPSRKADAFASLLLANPKSVGILNIGFISLPSVKSLSHFFSSNLGIHTVSKSYSSDLL